MATTLGVATGAYLPWCFLNLLNPIIGMIYGFTGWTIARIAVADDLAGRGEPGGAYSSMASLRSNGWPR